MHSLSQNFGVDLSNNYENKKAVGNLSGNTYVKDDIANLDDFETKPTYSPRFGVRHDDFWREL